MNAGESFVRVACSSDIAEGKSLRVKIGYDEVALWRVRGKLFAIGNVCAHQHFSELHRGILSGLTVTCPMHGWTYSLETGIAVAGSGRVPTYAVKVEGDDVYIERRAPEGLEPWTR